MIQRRLTTSRSVALTKGGITSDLLMRVAEEALIMSDVLYILEFVQYAPRSCFRLAVS